MVDWACAARFLGESATNTRRVYSTVTLTARRWALHIAIVHREQEKFRLTSFILHGDDQEDP
jgi:hypothetical protein